MGRVVIRGWVSSPGSPPERGETIDLESPAPDVIVWAMSRSPSAPETVPLKRPERARILGVDPGLQVTGYAVLEVRPRGPHVREAGIVRSDDGGDTADVAIRVRCLYDGILEVVKQYRPEVMALEQLFAHY